MRKRSWSTGLVLAAAAGIFFAFPLTAKAAPVFPEGISAGGQSLAGMTGEEAQAAVQQYIDSRAGQKVTLTVDGQDVETTAAGLGFHWSNTEAVEEAAGAYAGGSLIRQYMTQKDLKAAPVELALETAVDSSMVKSFVEEQCQGITAEPQDASITRENDQFIITEGVAGKAVDTEATESALNEALAGGLSEPVQVTASITEKQPAVTSEDLATIQDVLGTFTTDFSSSGVSRSTNVTVGASKINGHLLMPGEVLSGYECLQPFTTANGYRTAASYENGQVVDSIGGGVCQISTTLYNASLNAEIEIVQRQNHSMSVAYVKPSMDAAIAGTYKDLKIKNNYSTPIYVEGYTSGKKLTFNIYGKETRPENRKVEFISETTGTTSPGDPQLIVDPALAPGAQVRVQSSHTGLRSRLWKVVKVDGVEQERTLLNQDTYNASKAIYRVGPALPAVVPPESAENVPVPPDGTSPGGTPPADTSSTDIPPAGTSSPSGEGGGPGVTGPDASGEAGGSQTPVVTVPPAEPNTPAPPPSDGSPQITPVS